MSLTKEQIEEYGRKHKERIRNIRAELPIHKRVLEYLIDWEIGVKAALGLRQRRGNECRCISSDGAMWLIRWKHDTL